MTAVDLAIIILAAYRASNFVAHEGGPWNFMYSVRHRLGVYYDEYSEPQGRNVMANGIICMMCNSVWIGLLFTMIHVLLSGYHQLGSWPLFLPLAISGGVILLRND